MSKYLLGCECGEAVPVDLGQAGGRVVCLKCGRQLEVPPLRMLRHLPQATAAAEKASFAWGPRQGVMTAGVVLAVALLAVALWSRLSEPSVPEFSPSARLQSVDTALDTMTPVQAWDLWITLYRPMAERGLAVMEDPHKPAIEQYVAKKRFFQKTMLIAAGACAAVAAIAAVWPKKNQLRETRR
jgi:hypothetical protein